MPHILKVVANEEGRYPIRLFGEDYEIEPVKSKTTERKSIKEAGKPEELETKNGEAAQPTTEDNAPHNQTDTSKKS